MKSTALSVVSVFSKQRVYSGLTVPYKFGGWVITQQLSVWHLVLAVNVSHGMPPRCCLLGGTGRPHQTPFTHASMHRWGVGFGVHVAHPSQSPAAVPVYALRMPLSHCSFARATTCSAHCQDALSRTRPRACAARNYAPLELCGTRAVRQRREAESFRTLKARALCFPGCPIGQPENPQTVFWPGATNRRPTPHS